LHYAGPNRTDQPRRAVVFAFARPATPRAEPHDYHWQRPEWYPATQPDSEGTNE
jgi:hypothetical protein